LLLCGKRPRALTLQLCFLFPPLGLHLLLNLHPYPQFLFGAQLRLPHALRMLLSQPLRRPQSLFSCLHHALLLFLHFSQALLHLLLPIGRDLGLALSQCFCGANTLSFQLKKY
jgi:hypothetical protein